MYGQIYGCSRIPLHDSELNNLVKTNGYLFCNIRQDATHAPYLKANATYHFIVLIL